MRKYYEAYDDRYRQVHGAGLRWATDNPSPIVMQVMERLEIRRHHRILELGCGEGRDAGNLLRMGYHVLGTDISQEAVRCCRETFPEYQSSFEVLDCVAGKMDAQFDFIYAVAVIHMLVEGEHRDGFYRFVRKHLKDCGIGLICTMGDGTVERSTDISTAFDLQERVHQQSGKTMFLAGTSCRMVSFETFRRELEQNGLVAEEMGHTSVEPDFPVMMYAVVRKADR